MSRMRGAHGAALLMAVLVLACLVASFAALALAGRMSAARERATERALAQAREALIAYAVDRPINASVGPGYLPCPDVDGDGWAESTCGSLDGATGQASRLGLLPWKTLGVPELRDASGERLWYAVSTKYKGLLNCAESIPCVDMTPAQALGTITVRSSRGEVTYDGTATTGVVAVVIAAGDPLDRLEASGDRQQSRHCAPTDCDPFGVCITSPPQLAASCDPRNYLDRAPGGTFPGEDNADFVDRSDAPGRARNTNGFIMGPIAVDGGRVAVNDRVAVVAYEDILPRVMARVALEVAQCLRFYASRPENGGQYPAPEPACARGERFGTLPDTPFDVAGTGRLARWWRDFARAPESLAELPTHDDACRLAAAPDDPGPVRTFAPGMPATEGETAAAPSWWRAWKPLVFVTVPAGGVSRLDEYGNAMGTPQGAAVIVATGCPGADVCGDDACTKLIVGGNPHGLHAIATVP